MKKLIAISSLSLIAVLSVMLANAADETSNPPSSEMTSGYSESQKPGTMGTVETKEHTTTSRVDHWKTAKSCTDEAGVTYKRGHKGFNTCVEAMRKKEQMGGTAPTRPQESTGTTHEGTTETPSETHQ